MSQCSKIERVIESRQLLREITAELIHEMLNPTNYDGVSQGIRIILMVIHNLQWNARSLISNGKELKKLVKDKMKMVPDVICIQEMWLRPHLDFVITEYSSVPYARQGG